MFRKILITTCIFVITFSTSYAEFANGRVYLAPTLFYQNIWNNGNTRYEGIAPGLALGYGDWFYPWMTLSGEIFGTYHSMSISSNADDTPGLKPRYNWGLSVLFGFPLEEVLQAFIRVSYLNTTFDSMNTSKDGYGLGVGLIVNMDCHWDARIEYDFMKYGNVDGVGSLKANVIAVALIYSFG